MARLGVAAYVFSYLFISLARDDFRLARLRWRAASRHGRISLPATLCCHHLFLPVRDNQKMKSEVLVFAGVLSLIRRGATSAWHRLPQTCVVFLPRAIMRLPVAPLSYAFSYASSAASCCCVSSWRLLSLLPELFLAHIAGSWKANMAGRAALFIEGVSGAQAFRLVAHRCWFLSLSASLGRRRTGWWLLTPWTSMNTGTAIFPRRYCRLHIL